MTDTELARETHQNTLAFMRRFTELTEAGADDEAHGAYLSTLGVPLPFLNGVYPIEQVGDAPGLIDHADDWFRDRGAGFVVFTRQGDERDQPIHDECRRREFHFQERYPEMVCEERIAEPPLPDACELRLVEDEDAADTYWAVCDTAYQSLGFAANTFPTFPNAVLLEERTRAYVAYKQGQPVACALGWLGDDGINFIGWVATLPEARGTGLGTLVTAVATNSGFERGARYASLQASPMGFAVYKRMGYREIANYQIYARVY